MFVTCAKLQCSMLGGTVRANVHIIHGMTYNKQSCQFFNLFTLLINAKHAGSRLPGNERNILYSNYCHPSIIHCCRFQVAHVLYCSGDLMITASIKNYQCPNSQKVCMWNKHVNKLEIRPDTQTTGKEVNDMHGVLIQFHKQWQLHVL